MKITKRSVTSFKIWSFIIFLFSASIMAYAIIFENYFGLFLIPIVCISGWCFMFCVFSEIVTNRYNYYISCGNYDAANTIMQSGLSIYILSK